jgi:Tfp pilus assembly protein PilO
MVNTQYLMWLLAHAARKLGVWGLLALLAICASGVYYTSKSAEIKEEIHSFSTDLNQHAEPDTRVAIIEKPAEQTQQTLQDFYRIFPRADSIPDTLAQLNQLAAQQRIVLNSGDYKLTKITPRNVPQQAALTQYEMVLPVTGHYTQVRQFMSAMLSTVPSVAIADIQMHRDSTLTPVVDAKLVLVLFVKADPS